MTTTLNADDGVVSGSAGLKYSADSSGVLALQTNGTTAVSISTGQVVTLTNALAEASGGTGTTTGYYGFKNRIINGAMVIDQRNAGASVTPTSTNTYTIDRWKFYLSQASKFSTQQNAGSVTPPVGFSNYLGVTSLSAYTVGASENFTLSQVVEGFNTADLQWGTANAKTVTLSFWVRSSLTGTFGGAFGNTAGDRSYPFSYTISSANTWEQKSITIAGDTSGTWGTGNASSIFLYLNLGAGSTVSGTAGAWAGTFYASATGATSVIGTNGATFYITGVQLEKGSTATSFDYRPYGTELQLCQRYFERLPAGPMGMVAIRTGAWYGYIHWQTEKRTNATAVLNGTLNFVGSAGDVNTQTPVGIDQLTTKSCRVYLQTGSYTAQGAWIYINTSFDVSSEL